jgi:hypothetical protein
MDELLDERPAHRGRPGEDAAVDRPAQWSKLPTRGACRAGRVDRNRIAPARVCVVVRAAPALLGGGPIGVEGSVHRRRAISGSETRSIANNGDACRPPSAQHETTKGVSMTSNDDNVDGTPTHGHSVRFQIGYGSTACRPAALCSNTRTVTRSMAWAQRGNTALAISTRHRCTAPGCQRSAWASTSPSTTAMTPC